VYSSVLFVVLECFLGLLEAAVKYFNVYAYTNIAIYGNDYFTAAKQTWQLFENNIVSVMINDDLTGMVISLSCVLAGCVSGIVGALWAASLHFNGWVAVAVLAFVIGYSVASILFGCVESAVATTYVCWAEDPAALKINRPEYFKAIADASLKLRHQERIASVNNTSVRQSINQV